MRVVHDQLKNHIKSYSFLSSAGFFAGALLCLFTFMALMPTDPSGQIAEAATGTATASTTSLTLTTGSDTAKLDLMVNSAGGTFSSSSETEKAKFTVTTTNYTGYTLTILAKDNSGKLLNNEEYLESISSAISATTFNSNDYNGKWGYMPNKLNSSDNENFLPAPTSATTLNVTSGANSTADNYTIALGARADYTKPSGTYSNTFILTATANPVAYSITYDKGNTTDTVSGLPSVQSSSSFSGTSVTLSETIPTRTGYTFNSWCLGKISTASGTDACIDDPDKSITAQTFSAGSDFGIDQTTENKVTLYAMWTADAYDIIVNFAGEGISSVAFSTSGYDAARTVSSSGGTASLVYGVTYTITANFSSGYEFVSWAVNYGTLDSTSANPTTYETRAGTATITVTGKSSCTSTISGTMQNAGTTSSYCDGTFGKMTDSRDNQIYTVAKINGGLWMTRNLAIGCNGSGEIYGTTISSKSLSNSNSNVSSAWSTPTALLSTAANSYSPSGYTTAAMQCSTTYGGYYNYKAATAGTITGSSNFTKAQYDICPSGWRLPTHDEFKLLGNDGNGSATNAYVSVFLPVYSGNYDEGSLNNTNTNGYWWSSEAISSTARYYLNYYGGKLNSEATRNRRYHGFSVRCIRSA